MRFIPIILFTGTADGTVSNSTSESAVIGTGKGTRTLPSGYALVGTTIRVRLSGYYQTVSSTGANLTVRLYAGGGDTLVGTMGPVALNSGGANVAWRVEADLTLRTVGVSGTVMAQAQFGYRKAGSDPAWYAADALNTATASLDTSAAVEMQVTAQWDAADTHNKIVCTNAEIWVEDSMPVS